VSGFLGPQNLRAASLQLDLFGGCVKAVAELRDRAMVTADSAAVPSQQGMP
jgi:hypothetical protein